MSDKQSSGSPARRGAAVLAAGVALVLTGSAVAMAAEPAATAAKPVGLTGMNWAPEDGYASTYVWRVTNSTDQEITGYLQTNTGWKSETVTIPAGGTVYVEQEADYASTGTATFRSESGEALSGPKAANTWYATAHVAIDPEVEVEEGADADELEGAEIVANAPSTGETLTYVYDAESGAFVLADESVTGPAVGGPYVYENGKLDVAPGEEYTVTLQSESDAVEEGQGFGTHSAPDYVNPVQWYGTYSLPDRWDDAGKMVTLPVQVVVANPETPVDPPVDPEQPPVTEPDPEQPPVTEPGPQPPVSEPEGGRGGGSDAPSSTPDEELAFTGAPAALLALAGLGLVSGGAAALAASRRKSDDSAESMIA